MWRDYLACALFVGAGGSLICFAEPLRNAVGPAFAPRPPLESTSTRNGASPALVSVEDVKSNTLSEGKGNVRAIEVVLRNRSPRALTLLGAGNHCRPWGCCEALNLPGEIAAGGAFVLKIKADWQKTPIQPFLLTLFTSRSVDSTIQLRILPESVTIQPTDPRSDG